MKRRDFIRGWEFWLGAVFIAASVGIVGSALLIDSWGTRVSRMGAAVAAFAVVGAALVAYDGATAQVRHASATERRRIKALLTKLRIACFHLENEIAFARTKLENDIHENKGFYPTQTTAFRPVEYVVRTPKEFDEAWERLEQMPDACAWHFANIRLALGRAETWQASLQGAVDRLARIGRNDHQTQSAEALHNALAELAKSVQKFKEFLTLTVKGP